MEEEDKKFIKRAIDLAIQGMSNNLGGPFGAVIVKEGKIISEGSNRVTSQNDPTAHAEILAIRQACVNLGSFHLDECTLYTSCEPCPMCLGAIYWARIKRVVFASTREDASKINFDDQFIYEQIELPHSQRSIEFTQMTHEEVLNLFREWLSKDDRIEY